MRFVPPPEWITFYGLGGLNVAIAAGAERWITATYGGILALGVLLEVIAAVKRGGEG